MCMFTYILIVGSYKQTELTIYEAVYTPIPHIVTKTSLESGMVMIKYVVK